MPLCWDWSETRVFREREGRYRDMWDFIVKERGGPDRCAECGAEVPDLKRCPKCGSATIFLAMRYNYHAVIPLWLYVRAGGRYGERGAEELEGRRFVMTRGLAEKFCDEFRVGRHRDALVEGIIGLRVWARL
jgi:hypothetical protein